MTDDLRGVPLEELLAEVEAAQLAPEPGQAFLTCAEWARVWGVSAERARRALRLLRRAGRLESARRVDTRVDGVRCTVPVYRPLPPARGEGG